MKGFFATLVVVCAVIAAAWFLYDPYIRPMLEGDSEPMVDESAEPAAPSAPTPAEEGPDKGMAKPAQPVSYKEKPNEPEEVEKSEIDRFLEERYPMPQILPLGVIVGNWESVPERAFPREVISSEPISFDLIVDGQKIGSSNVAPGTPLKPLRLVGDQLTVGNAANPGMSKVVPVDSTDFKQRIQQRYDEFVSSKKIEVETKRAQAKQAIEANPDLMAKATGEGAEPAEMVAGTDPKFAPVQASLRNGDVSSVKPEEATGFYWIGTEKIGGDMPGTYETVLVEFEVETIFGTFPAIYKALLDGGRVVGWIDPVTEDRI